MTAPEGFRYHHLDGEHVVLVCDRCAACVPDAHYAFIYASLHNEWHATLAGWQNAVDNVLDRIAQS